VIARENYRPAHGGTEIVLRECRLAPSRLVGKEIVGVKIPVAEEFEHCQMQVVAARTNRGIDDGRTAAKLCAEC